MRTPTFLFARAELARHKRGWLLVAVITIVGISVATGATAGARRTLTSFERFRTESLEPHALLAAEGNGPSPVSAEEVAAVEGVEVVGEASALLMAFVDRGLIPGLNMVVIAAADDHVFTDVYVPRVLEGRLPRADASDELSINERLADDLDLAVGDRLSVTGPTPSEFQKLVEHGVRIDTYGGPSIEVTVVGITRTTSNLEDMTFQSYEALASKAFQRAVGNDIAIGARLTAVRLHGGDAGVDPFLEAADSIVPDDGPQFDPNYLSGTDGVNGAIRIQAIGLALFAVVALIATVVAVGQAVARQRTLALEDARGLTVLGLRNREAIATLLAPTTLVLGTSTIAGAAVAVASSGLLPFGLARRAEPDPGLWLDPLTQLGIPIAMASILVAIEAVVLGRAFRRRSATAAAAPGVKRSPRAGVVISAARALPPAEVGMRLALSREGRNVPLRSALAASTFALAAIAGTAIVAATVVHVSTDARAAGFPWDYKVALGPAGDLEEEVVGIVEEASDTLTLAYEGYTTVDGRPTSVLGLRALRGSTSLALFDGRSPQADDEIVLGVDAADELRVGVGDTVRVGDGASRFRVVGRGLVPMINSDQRHSGGVITGTAFERLHPQESESDGRTLLIGWTDDRAAVDEALAGVDEQEYFGETPFRPTDLSNLRQIGRVPDALVAFLALLAVAALAHSLTTIARARSNDLATLRALGFTRADVRWTVTWQSVTIAAAAILIGLPVGVVAGRVAWQALAVSLKTVATPEMPVAPLLLAIPAAMTTALLLAAPVGHRAARRSVAAALRTE